MPLEPKNCWEVTAVAEKEGKYRADTRDWAPLEYGSPLLAAARDEDYDERHNQVIHSLLLANQGICLPVIDSPKRFEEGIATIEEDFSDDLLSAAMNLLTRKDTVRLQDVSSMVDSLESYIEEHEVLRTFAQPSHAQKILGAYVCGVSIRGLVADYEDDGIINPLLEFKMADKQGSEGFLPLGYRAKHLLVPDLLQ